MSKHIDLNCDMGESYGAWTMGQDEALLELATSANIACGYHAGDPATMMRTARIAVAKGVAVGAHPSLPDLQGFGRRTMAISPDEARAMTLYQIGALDAFARAAGGRLAHVKAHGALYNMAARDRRLADAIASAVRDFDPALILVGLSGSELIKAGRAAGLTCASEVFADRGVEPDGSLTPRGQPGAMIEDEDLAVTRVLRMIEEGKVTGRDGVDVAIQADTVCIHGDQPKALAFARRLRDALAKAGVEVRVPSRTN
ncbi:MAG: LamB/YcsF family protein [Holophaga sp.]|nr:LamB/YcsF family protein [Holophaga sp.]